MSVIEPVVITYAPEGRQLALRVDGRSISEFLTHLANTWTHFAPEAPIKYSFLDDNFARLAEDEQKLGRAVSFFTLLAVLIACAGLFGLSAFAAQRRTKEIGIRKVFGATVTALVMLLTKDFSRLVLIAFAVAAPLAYLAMDYWLSGFAYRIELSVAPFVIVGIATLSIALLTICYHALRAAMADPVKSLRYE